VVNTSWEKLEEVNPKTKTNKMIFKEVIDFSFYGLFSSKGG